MRIAVSADDNSGLNNVVSHAVAGVYEQDKLLLQQQLTEVMERLDRLTTS